MITKDALAEYKTYNDPYQVEKDYLQDLLLYNIYANSSNEMVLKEGTAFAKFYNSDRFSEDLDFTLSEKVEKQEEFAKSIIRNAVEKLEYRHSIPSNVVFPDCLGPRIAIISFLSILFFISSSNNQKSINMFSNNIVNYEIY